jgi:hypothetical protein
MITTTLNQNKKKHKNKNKLEEKSENVCETTNECFICLENYYNDEVSIKLNENPYYSKNCDCNSWVHNYCLNKWYATSSYICPICRKYIFTDLYQYHYSINEVPLNEENEEPVNQNQRTIRNNFQINHFVIIISKMKKKDFLLLVMLSFISCFYLYIKENGKGFAF